MNTSASVPVWLTTTVPLFIPLVTGVAYASGYFTQRIRASALGILPEFELVDQLYVFTGFKFLFVWLVGWIISLPIISVLYSRLLLNNEGDRAHLIYKFVAVFLSVVSVFGIKLCLSSDDVFLSNRSDASGYLLNWFNSEYIDNISFLVSIISTSLIALCLQQSKILVPEKKRLSGTLVLVLFLQVIWSHLIFGTKFLERNMFVVEMDGELRSIFSADPGLVTRTAKTMTFVGLNRKHNLVVLTMAQDKIPSIQIKRIISINSFLEETRDRIREIKTSPTSPAEKTSGDLARNVVSEIGRIFRSAGSLSQDYNHIGELWVLEIDGIHRKDAKRIGQFSDISFPVSYSGEEIYAIQKGNLVKIVQNNVSLIVEERDHDQSIALWSRLVGVTEEGTVLGFVSVDGTDIPAILRRNKLILKPKSFNKKELGILKEDAKTYKNDITLSCRKTPDRPGYDIYFRKGKNEQKLYDCNGRRCCQASLQPNEKRIFFVKKARY